MEMKIVDLSSDTIFDKTQGKLEFVVEIREEIKGLMIY